jgi:ribonucleotide reductase beta subunit family protein with ferritin-like domain
MNLISVEGKTNFFEKKNSSYSRTAVITTKEQQEVRFDEDF